MHSINIFLLYSLLVLLFNPGNMRPLLLSSSSETKLLDFHSFPQGNLTFLGDSHLQDRAIALTKEDMLNNVARSAGVVLYSHPILFLDPNSKRVPSFHTKFTFSIQNIYGDDKSYGDGLAFLISADDGLVGSPGYLGLVDSSDLTRNKFIAIEFDTKCDTVFHDPDDNHVGLDISSLFSVKIASSLSVDFKSGNSIVTWIEYKSDENRLEVFLSNSYLKPLKPLLKVDIDLSNYLKERMFVGFSGATEGSMQYTHIEEWEFTIADSSPPPPPPPPESVRTSVIHAESTHARSHLSRLAIGLIVGVCCVPFIVLFSWFTWKKLTGIIHKSEEINNLEMQTIMSSSGGISYQEIQLTILAEGLARGFKGLNIENMLNCVTELVRVNTEKSIIPLCNSSPAVKPNNRPFCNGLPSTSDDVK